MMSHVVAPSSFSLLSPSHASSGTISTFFGSGRKLPLAGNNNNNQKEKARRTLPGSSWAASILAAIRWDFAPLPDDIRWRRPIFFSPLLLFFFACILFFNFVKRMPDIVSPSHSSPPTRFVCFWRPPRGTFNVPQGHVIKYVSKAAAGGI